MVTGKEWAAMVMVRGCAEDVGGREGGRSVMGGGGAFQDEVGS